jgi:hypothetical protein
MKSSNMNYSNYLRKEKKEEDDALSLFHNIKKLHKEMDKNTPRFQRLKQYMEEHKKDNSCFADLLWLWKMHGQCFICYALTHKEEDPVTVYLFTGSFDNDDLIFEEYFIHQMMDHDVRLKADNWRKDIYRLCLDIKHLCDYVKNGTHCEWKRKIYVDKNLTNESFQYLKKMKEMIDHTPLNLSLDYTPLYRAVIYRVNQVFKL